MNILSFLKTIALSWWRNVDRYLIFCMLLLSVIGILLVYSGSPAVAKRLGYSDMHFFYRHLVFVSLSCFIIIAVSLFSTNLIKYFSIIGIFIGFLLLVALLLFSRDINGAKRWINIFYITIQPSEFVKVFFIVVTSWILSFVKNEPLLKSKFFYYSLLFWSCFIFLLILQPDLGMSIIVSVIWGGQLFLAGLPVPVVILLIFFIILGVICAYFFFPHVTNRIDSFLDSSNALGYQVQKSLEAFKNGGLVGVGPGGGSVKMHLPDSHTDFIFAVAGEEMGAVLCIFIVCIYCFIVIKSFLSIYNEKNFFIIYTVGGLSMLFGFQSIVNIGVSLSLLPNKGMTLPLISYGGSSFLSISLASGILLSLTKKKYGRIFLTDRILINCGK